MSNIEYTSEEGCESSRADAKHDFHTIFDSKNIQEYVSKNIPSYEGIQCDILDEDRFIDKYELKLSSKDTSANHKSEPDFISTHLNDSITSRYVSFSVIRKQHDYKEETKHTSFLQEKFQEIGIQDDIFFICDVAYANVREDLKFADPSLRQTFYWVQNAQTMYDPAGKTTWHSDKPYFEDDDDDGEDEGKVTSKSKSKTKTPSSPSSPSSSLRIKCQNHFKMKDSKFLFCWQNANKNIVTLYPEWSKKKFPTKEVSYKFSENNPEQMLYINKNLFMAIRSNDVNDYSTHETNLIITDPTKPGYYGYADKVLAAKGSGILSASELASYRAKGYDLRRFVKFINDSIKNQTSTKLYLDELMNYSPEFQVLAKKVGDASQSLSCCQKQINLQKFKNPEIGPKGENNIEDFVSNGNHAFVSFDRIAIGCALNYNCPIVIGNTQESFTIYVQKDLINIHNQIKRFFNKTDDNYDITNSFKENTGSFILNADFYETIKENKNGVITNIKTACSQLNIIPSSDITYQNFLINYFIELNVLKLFSNLDMDILNFDVTDFNDKLKEIYSDKLPEIQDKMKNLGIKEEKYSDLIIEPTNDDINGIMINIINNINGIFLLLQEEYEQIKPSDISKYKAEDNKDKHKKFRNILEVLKTIFCLIVCFTSDH